MSSRFQSSVSLPLLLACLLVVAVGKASALEPATPLARLGRQSWTMENGLPQNTVSVLLQSRGGFLWAGTELGLARFDGVSFRLLDHGTTPGFPDAEIRCLLDSPRDGSLWIGTSDGLVHWQQGAATRYGVEDGLPSAAIREVVVTSDGTPWVWTENGLARWNGRRFLPQLLPGIPGDSLNSVASGTAGSLWVGSSHGSALWKNGRWSSQPEISTTLNGKPGSSDAPVHVKPTTTGGVLVAGDDGVDLVQGDTSVNLLPRALLPAGGASFLDRTARGLLVAANKSEIVLAQGSGAQSRLIGRLAVSRELPGSRIESLLSDREGSLWVGTNHGLARILFANNTPTVQRMPATDPLATNTILSLLEDREGDLWVGTESAGLHILRDSRFRFVGASDGLTSDATTAIVQDSMQSMWIGTRDSGLNRLAYPSDGPLAIRNLTTKDGLLSNVILSLAAAPNGDLWVGTPDGLNRVSGKKIASFTSADGLPDDFIRSVLAAPDGSVWIGTRRGLTHLKPGIGQQTPDHARFETYTHADGLGSDLIGALALGSHGELWIATLNGLSRFQNGKFQNATTADGLSSNVITALDVTPDGMVWIGTQGDGLNLWNGKQFLAIRNTLAKSDRSAVGWIPSWIPGAIHAILDDGVHLWLASDQGLTRVDRAFLLTCAQQGNCSPNSASIRPFTTADGLRSRETSSNSHPTASRAKDGLLWFATPRGVIVVDPLHFPPSPPPPPVSIERFAVDDRDISPGADASVRITAGAMRFQFDYAGLSFATPQKLRYQYMLEGFDHSWTDAGARRTAYYTNIPPAQYRFRVRAALSEAAFAEAGQDASRLSSGLAYDMPQEAALSFELEPHFYQTLWFRALLILLLAALVFFVFRRRVKRVEREFGAVMGERNRIAREIHDTLAQGYVGISLQLEILGELLRLNRTDAAQKHLTLTQGMVREGLDDARQSIWALRSQDAGEQTLPIRLRRLVEQAADSQLSTDLKVHGAFRSLAPDAEQEVLRIAQEAIHNVRKHAAATRIDVRLDYDERALALSVTDNGKGFETQAWQSGQFKPAKPDQSEEGHYGLTGMRERAALIHATIEIKSEPGSGTTVDLRVPAPEAR